MQPGDRFDPQAWLGELGLPQYADAFIDNDIDASVLPALTSEDLRELGVQSIGHRRRILAAAAAIATDPGATATAPSVVPARSAPAAIEPVLERRQITVLFCDMVGSTELSASEDPEDLREFLNLYRGALTRVVERYHGSIAQYLGDGVMAYFGYPQAHEHDGEHAVSAALAILQEVAQFPPFGGRPARVRIGIATGLTVVARGDNSGDLTEENAIGETPHLAARLQSIAAPNTVVVAPSTRALIGDLFECEDCGTHELKGFAQPVRAWRVVRESASTSRFEALRMGRRRVALVGRVSESAWLKDRMSMARAGNGQIVVVVGEGGIGKSRLVGQVLEELGLAQRERLTLQCSPYNQSTPLHVMRYYIERIVGMGSGDAPAEATRRLGALLAQAGAVTPERLALLAHLIHFKGVDTTVLAALPSFEVRERTLKLLSSLIEAIAQEHGVLLIEDVQWIDPSTSELFEQLALILANLPVLVIATARPGPLPAWAEEPNARHVRLDRLDTSETRRLVAAVAEPGILPASVLDEIVARSDGVPIFAEELTRGYIETDARRPEGGLAERVPATLTESLLARLDGLEYGREIASVAALIGREFPVVLLFAVTGPDRERAERGIQELLDAGVLVAGHSRFGRAIAFRHSLVREAAYELLPRRERTRLHALLVETIQSDFPQIADAAPHMLAIHLTEAGQQERAISEWQRAGADADRRSAYKEAAARFERALELTLGLEASTQRDERELALRINLAGLRLAASGFSATDVDEHIDRVTELTDRLGSRASIVPALALKWLALAPSNRPSTDDLIQQMLASAETGSDIDRLIAYRLAETTMIFKGEFRAGVSYGERFFAIYRPEIHDEELAKVGPSQHGTMAMVGMAECHTFFGSPELAAPWRARALESARTGNDVHTRCSALVFAGCFLSYLGCDLEALYAGADELRRTALAHDVPYWRGHADLFHGLSLIEQGRDEEGFAHAYRGVETIRTVNAYSNIWYMIYGDLCLRRGRYAEGLQILEWAAPSINTGVRWYEAEYFRVRAGLRHGLGYPRDLVSSDLEMALRVARAQGATLFVDRIAASEQALQVPISA